MYEGFEFWSFMMGLPLGLAIASVLTFIGWRRGRKERLFDERYTRIHQHARSISWIVTTFSILIVWGVIIIVEGPGLSFFLMAGLWITHMVSFGIGGAIASTKN